jgi:deoxyhypusine synthase
MDNDDSYDHVVPGSDEELNTPDVRGYDFRGEFDFHEMLDAYATTIRCSLAAR